MLHSSLRLAAVIGIGFTLASLYCAPAHGRLDFSQCIAAIRFQVRHGLDGHGGVFLLGQWHDHESLWYYFPVALSIKSSLALPLLALVPLLLRPRTLVNWAVCAAGVLLAFSLTCKIQIGVRYFLPLLALATIGVSAAAVRTAASARVPALRKAAVAGWALAACWAAFVAARTWPDGLRYTNEIWGGRERGYLLLSDSNYDWGQGLKELAAWQATQHVPELDVVYFGTEPVARHYPVHAMPLEALGLDVEHPGGLIAISTTILAESPLAPNVVRLRAMTPVARTGTFLIYDLECEKRLALQTTK